MQKLIQNCCTALVFSTLMLTGLAEAQTHADLNISRKDAREAIAEALFDNQSTYHDYNDWRNATNDVSADTALSTNWRYCSHSAKGGHPGIDIQTQSKRIGEVFYSLDSGIVKYAGGDNLNRIAIYNPHTNRTTLYLHNSRVLVSEGEFVNKGDPIGEQGDQGSPGRVHVHIEVLAGEHNQYVCGADHPQNSSIISVDPVPYLFSRSSSSPYNYEKDSDDGLENAYRVAASKILPSMIRSSNSRLKCDGEFRIDFEFSSYAPQKDIAVVVGLYDRNRNRVINRIIDAEELSDRGESGFVVTSDNGLPEKVYRVRADVRLSNAESDDLGSRTLVRAYTANKAVQMTLPDFDEADWASAYSLFVPTILSDNFGEGNEPYTRGDQSHAQRYIEIDTSNCR